MSDTPIHDNIANPPATVEDDPTTKAGLIARTRKASVAGSIAFAGALGPAIIVATASGHVNGAGFAAIIVTAAGLGVGTWFATWATPNKS